MILRCFQAIPHFYVVHDVAQFATFAYIESFDFRVQIRPIAVSWRKSGC